ncbi:hypothetical protein ACIU3Q_003041 [Salmonella enterica subsp. enterica serovar Kokomlemle]
MLVKRGPDYENCSTVGYCPSTSSFVPGYARTHTPCQSFAGSIEQPGVIQIGNHISQITTNTLNVAVDGVAGDQVMPIANTAGWLNL